MRYLALLSAFLALPMLVGCPARPPVTDCTPNATQCHEGRPQVCSPEHRWYDTAPEPCATGSVCCLTASGDGAPIHACVSSDRCVSEELGQVRAPGTATDDSPKVSTSPEQSTAQYEGYWSADPSGQDSPRSRHLAGSGVQRGE